MSRAKNIIFYTVLALIVLAGLLIILGNKGNQDSPPQFIQGKIGDWTLKLEIADTDAKKERGLSGRAPLEEDEGMLFAYDKPGFYHFWMKEMNFPLDLVWLDQNKKIVDISYDLTPETYPKTFTGKAPAQYVLEIKAELAKKHYLKEGDTLEIINN